VCLGGGGGGLFLGGVWGWGIKWAFCLLSYFLLFLGGWGGGFGFFFCWVGIRSCGGFFELFLLLGSVLWSLGGGVGRVVGDGGLSWGGGLEVG